MVGRRRCLMPCWGLVLLLALGTAQSAEPPALFIEAALDPPDPYLQAEVRYSVRLYRRSSLLQGYLLLPELQDLAVELVQRGEPVPVEKAGRRYEMIEYHYLLYPQRSGRIAVPGMVYSGREVYLKGEPLTLEVRPPVADQRKPWLPARSLRLSEDWRTPEPPWQVGDPLERVLILEAEGLTGAQLPDLGFSVPADIEVQPLGTQTENRLVEGRMLGRRTERFRLIPRRAGRHELPPLRIAWWDLAQDLPRQAALPGRSLEIAAVADASVAVPASQPASEEAEDALADLPSGLLSIMLGAVTLLVLTGLLAAGWSSPRWQRRRQRGRCLRRLSRACRQNDPAAAGSALLHWASVVDWETSVPQSLGGLAARLEDLEAAAALWALDACLYRGAAAAWNGVAFRRRILPALSRHHGKGTATATAVLPPLNP